MEGHVCALQGLIKTQAQLRSKSSLYQPAEDEIYSTTMAETKPSNYRTGAEKVVRQWKYTDRGHSQEIRIFYRILESKPVFPIADEESGHMQKFRIFHRTE